MRLTTWALLLLAAGVGVAAPPTPKPAAPPVERRPPTGVATLSNGLRLLTRANDASEIVSIVCLVRAGLPDESEDQAGVTALCAESILKGLENRSDKSFLAEIERSGGNLGTVPGYDFTQISIVTGRDQYLEAIKLLADVVARPRFSEADIAAARESIKQRVERAQDDLASAAYQALTAELYPRSPYGRPLTGFTQTLDRLTAADVRAYWKRCYVQNRMAVAIVGDIQPSAALSAAQKAFADLPFSPGSVTEKPSVAGLARSRVQVLQRQGPAAQLMIGFLTPGATRANYPVYAVLDAILGGGKRARLFANIREKHSLGYDLGSFYTPLVFQSHHVGFLITPPTRVVIRGNPPQPVEEPVLEPAQKLLIEQYRQLASTGPTDAELTRARAYVIGRYALRSERSRDQAYELAWNVAMGLGADFDRYLMSRVANVTRDEVLAAAKASLTNYALVIMVPTPERDE